MEEDILYKAAKAFERITEFDYIYVLGNRKKQIRISVLSNKKEEFTHIFGIDHLTDVPVVTGKNLKQKVAIYKRILSGKITFSNIKNSRKLNEPIDNTYNSEDEKPYTIKDRIIALKDIEKILDNSYKGKLYRWNTKRSYVKKPDGSVRRIQIRADYMLAVPSERNPKEKYYIFMYQSNKGKTDEPLKLNVFSAFPDCLNLAGGQSRPYTILKTVKKKVSSKIECLLYIHPKYKG